jgi:hypothetical protein
MAEEDVRQDLGRGRGPKLLSREILTTIPKKGELLRCLNCWDITVLSVPSNKVWGNILIEKKNHKGIDKEFGKEQAAF